jgi:hypothetical protein
MIDRATSINQDSKGDLDEDKRAIDTLQVCGCCSGGSVRWSRALFVRGGGRRRMWEVGGWLAVEVLI